MRRRDLFAVLGAAALAAPIAEAEGAEPPLVGMLLGGSAEVDKARHDAFTRALASLGWHEGTTVRFERRDFSGDLNRAKGMAEELVALAPSAIWTLSSPALMAFQQATRTIPIVFMNVADPVKAGFVTDIAHPDGNVTGFTVFEPGMGGKWLEILREIAPRVSHVGMLFEKADVYTEGFVAAAAPLGMPATIYPLGGLADIESAIATVARNPGGGLIVAPNNIVGVNRKRIFALATEHHLPAVYAYEFYAQDGGLVAYGPDLIEQAKGCAGYVDKILRGAKPADLPIQLPTKYKLVINVKAAQAIGLTISPTLLARADEVIE